MTTKMISESSQRTKSLPWGWITLGMCVPVYLVIIIMKINWVVKTMLGSFILYTGLLIAGIGLPILLLIQAILIGRGYFTHKIPHRQDLVLFLITSALYGIALWLGANLTR